MNAKEIVTQVLSMSDVRAGKILKYVFSEISKRKKFDMSIFEDGIKITETGKRLCITAQPVDALGMEFERFRKLYPGTKRGFATEYGNLQRKHEDWTYVVPLLVCAITEEIEWHTRLKKAHAFCPEYKNLQTWINQRCWEQTLNQDQLKNGRNRELDNSDNALAAIRSVTM